MNKKLTKLLSVFVIAGAIGVGAAFSATGCTKGNDDQNQTQTATVTEVKVTGSTTVANGGTVQLTAEVVGTNGPSQEVTWKIKDGATATGATVTSAGLVSAGTVAGKVTIIATSVADPTKSGELEITVRAAAVAQPTVTGVTAGADKTTGTVGEKITLTATVVGDNNPSQDVAWAITEGGDYATLSGNELTLTAAGTVKVQATSVADATKKSEVLAITVQAAQVIDNAVFVEYEGAADGPQAGTQDVALSLLVSEEINAGTITSWTDGTFTVTGGEARNRVDSTSKYSRSVKNGVITINAPAGAKLEIYFSSGSSTVGNAGYQLTKPDGSSETEIIKLADKALTSVTVENTDEGVYTFKTSKGTVDVYECKLSYEAAASAIARIEITDCGTTDYLVTQKVDCTNLSIVAYDEKGYPHGVDLKNCKIDASAYDPTVSGEYEIGVTYYLSDNLGSDKTEFKATYTIKVYMVDSITLSTIALSSSKQVSVQQAYLTNGAFNSDYLSVMATCKLGDDTIEQKLKTDWYDVTTPALTAEGTQKVTVSVNTDYTVDGKTVSAEYEVVVKAKKDVTDNIVEVTVGETGEFATLTQAVQYLKACNYESSVNKVIKIAAGTYNEKVWLDIPNVTLVGLGEDMDDTVLTYSLVEGDADVYSGSLWALNCATLHVTGANFKCYNLSIRNDFDYIKNSGNYSGSQAAQGVALTIDADGAVIYQTHLYGNQDTLYMKSGRTYYYQSQIDGNIDFIFGGETGLAFFEDCDIVAVGRAANGSQQNGYVTAAKHTASTKPDYGYIFYNCDFTNDEKVLDGSMSLGRPWGESATVAYINCNFSKAYSSTGYGSGSKTDRWSAMSSSLPTNADFCEYGSTGEGAISAAVNGGSILTAERAANYTKANIFAATNGKQTAYTTKFDCDAEYVKLRILAGLSEGDLPQETTVTFTLLDEITSTIQVSSEPIEILGGVATLQSGKLSPNDNSGCCIVTVGTVIQINNVGEVTLAWYNGGTDQYGNDNNANIVYKEGKATITILATGTASTQVYLKQITVDYSITPDDTPESASYSVSFDLNGASDTAPSTQTIEDGNTASAPFVPVRDGYKFLGWYTQATDGTAFDFSDGITGDITLYAHWEEVTAPVVIEENATITFGTGGNYQEYLASTSIIGTNVNSSTYRNNGGNNTQLSDTFSIKVKAGAVVTVSSYSGYTHYTVSLNGGTASEEQTGTSYELNVTANDDGQPYATVTFACGGNNYFYSISVAYPGGNVITEDTTITFGTAGNYQEYIESGKLASTCQIGGNNSDNSQVKNGTLTISVKAGARVVITAYNDAQYVGYTVTLGDGDASDTQTGNYTISEVSEDTAIVITPTTSNNYLVSIAITYSAE